MRYKFLCRFRPWAFLRRVPASLLAGVIGISYAIFPDMAVTQITAPETAQLSIETPAPHQSLEQQYSQAAQDFRTASGLAAHYTAARRAAAVRYTQGRFMAAQWWLRQAANYAPSRADADANRADFLRIRDQAGFNSTLNFNIARSDNINNGVDDPIFTLGDIVLVFPPSALALSGIEYVAQASAEYRISRSARQQTLIDAAFYGRTYTLSSSAKALAPAARASDYNLTQLAFGATHARILKPNWAPSQARFSLGKVWSGDRDQRWFQRLDLKQSFVLKNKATAALSGYAERQRPLEAGQPNVTLWGAKAEYSRTLPWRDIFATSFEALNYDADIATYAYQTQRLRLSYSLARPVLGLDLSFLADLSYKSYDEFSISLDGRRDQRAEIAVTAGVKEFAVFGFSPYFTIAAHKTKSNVERYDTSGVSLGLGFASRF